MRIASVRVIRYIDENKDEPLKNSEPVNRNVYMSIELCLAEGSEGNKDLYGYNGNRQKRRESNKCHLKLCP